ncbi:MAG: glucose-1-phosphate cytidylyltransferase [Elusimicrobiales bacterium]|nr:glucose-1-phosphate cytidylyltransferase [Elusimicrobiales bacterium]
MKVVILAGGMGTRLSEETDIKPKPMTEIGTKPMLWHIMKIYSHYGFNDFVLCLGYKGYMIKEYFANYFLHQADVTIDMKNNKMEVHHKKAEPWKVTLVDTGLNTMTGGRIKRVQEYVGKKPFMLTYGDGVADVDLKKLAAYHKKKGGLATMTAIQPQGRFGAVNIAADGAVSSFQEKPQGDGAWINGGFFVLEPGIFDYIKDGDPTIWERAPLENLAADGKLAAYTHTGFWKCMDTLRDKLDLENHWKSGDAPWKVWK